MKKNIKFLTSFLAAASFLLSCSNHIEDLLVQQETTKLVTDTEESKVETTCSLTLDANGGEFIAVNDEKSSTKSIVITDSEGTSIPKASEMDLKREGYTFLGWVTCAEDETVAYGDGVCVSFGEDTTLFALWSEYEVLHTLTFDANGGEILAGTQSVGKNSPIIIPNDRNLGLARDGFVLVGWTETADGDTALFVPGDKASFGEDTTLYALWKKDSCKVTFDANGGQIETDSQEVSTVTKTALPTAESLKLSRDGYVFAGWAVQDGDESVVLGDGADILPDGDITLRAVWAEKSSVEFIHDDAGNITGVRLLKSFPGMDSFSFSSFRYLDYVYIDGSIGTVPAEMFKSCQKLAQVEIGEGVAEIGRAAFAYCPSLESITIPDSVQSIGDYAFFGDIDTSLLSSFPFGYSSILNEGDAPSLYTEKSVYELSNSSGKKSEGKMPIKEMPIKEMPEVGIGTTVIPKGLKYVTFGNTMKNIGKGAFGLCAAIESITIPDSVQSIGDSAFYNCSSLTGVTIPDSLSISSGAFSGCSSLTEVTISANIKSIKNGAFSGFRSLKNVIIEDGIESIGEQAFEDCSSFTSITIPDSVQSIGDSAFSGCTSLTSITIPEGVKSIENSTFNNCRSLTSITIPVSVQSIGDSAFYNCSSLTSITIPDSVQSIGEQAFSGCSSLTEVSIPDSVQSIGDFAFSDCSSLMSVTIPDSFQSIGASPFFCCSSNMYLYIPSCYSSEDLKKLDITSFHFVQKN